MVQRSQLGAVLTAAGLCFCAALLSASSVLSVAFLVPAGLVSQHFVQPRGAGARSAFKAGEDHAHLGAVSSIALATLALSLAARRCKKSRLAQVRAGRCGAVALNLSSKQGSDSSSTATQEELKKQVGYKAVDDYVRSGDIIGLGTGSTSYFAVERVGQLLRSGALTNILAVPTSVRTRQQAEALGIPVTTLDEHSHLDVAIDGADEVDRDFNLTKGGGGALFREKMVETSADKFIVIVDESKMSDGLGPGFPVPVEIVPFCHQHTMRQLAALPAVRGCNPVLRLGSEMPFVTDNGNFIVDLHFTSPIEDVVAAAEQLKNTVGVVEHGLFIGMTTCCIIAGQDGITVRE